MEAELVKKPRPKTRRSKQTAAPVSDLVEQVAQLPEVQDDLHEDEATTSGQSETVVAEESTPAPPVAAAVEEAGVRVRQTETVRTAGEDERLQPDNRISSVFQATPISPAPVSLAPRMAPVREMPLSALVPEQKPVVPERKMSPKPLPPLVTAKPPQAMAIDLYPSLPTPAAIEKPPNFLEAMKTAAALKPAMPLPAIPNALEALKTVAQKPAMPLPAVPNALEALKAVAQKPAMPLPLSVQQPLPSTAH